MNMTSMSAPNKRVVVIGGRPTRGGNHLTRALQNALPDLDIRTVLSEEG